MIAALLLAALASPTLSSAAAPAGLPTAGAPPQGAVEATAEGLKSEIDASLRWLRAQQDLTTGAYGDVETTAWVVRAFIGSPRGYHVSDGPFLTKALDALLTRQRPDGAVADADAAPHQVLAQTLAVAQTLSLIDEEPALAMFGRARAFLGLASVEAPHPAATDAATAARMANNLLAQRDKAGFWEGYGGRTLTTAKNVWELSGYHDAVKAAEPKAAPVEPVPLPAARSVDNEQARQGLARGAGFLVANSNADGLWGALGQTDPGITAMVVGALLTTPEPRGVEVESAINKGLDYLRGLKQKDGSIHAGAMANYVTSASVLALTRAGRTQDVPLVEGAREFLLALQADEGEGYGPSDRYYGGVGYGGDERPDLSNLQLALEALAAAGVEEGDEAYKKALIFLQRTQNRSESNDLVLVVDGDTVRPGNDGGAGYAPGESKAGFVELADGTKIPRSYGSMTYALLRGYLFAGLPKDDPRVEMAWKWLTENYTLDINPGFAIGSDPSAPYQGLYYYFYSMSKALDTYGQEQVVDGAGVAHDWREELAGRLTAMQRLDGSWINANSPRWWEGNPVLATAYAMLALEVTARGLTTPGAPAAGNAGDGHTDHEHR
ncbi:prenyltransferase/squalene oxidase repeat-containing protein [Engelhardtia mirabilis]|uniref:Squalene cyclase C-terminal domain-containing protein n=1 Tax=Engelhardtia mirabilis TaxID=2528011 RepID=A0A518BM94_9BACT|nr:hypothetical protein Pla133_31940 [Planctomycetes bacterium Pla133]QDV02426.1 hypothetical protein Pla86_31930 [Planctomycetes bacterium Pla86]